MSKLLMITNILILLGSGMHYAYNTMQTEPVKVQVVNKNDVVIVQKTNDNCPVTCPLQNVIMHRTIGPIYVKEGTY